MLAGPPRETNGYEVKEVDGIKVYLQKGIKANPQGIDIDLVGFGPFKQLIVEGISVH